MPANDGISTTTPTNGLEIRGFVDYDRLLTEPDILKPRRNQSN